MKYSPVRIKVVWIGNVQDTNNDETDMFIVFTFTDNFSYGI